jgi:hypothetical protein
MDYIFLTTRGFPKVVLKFDMGTVAANKMNESVRIKWSNFMSPGAAPQGISLIRRAYSSFRSDWCRYQATF